MKVLQINKYFYPKGGSESVFFSTLEILQKNGIETTSCAVRSNRNKAGDHAYFIDFPELSEVGFFQKIKYILRFFYNKDACRKLEQLICEQKPDIAHIHLMFNSFSVAILPLLKKYDIPVVLTLHDYRLICPNSLLMSRNKKICEKCIGKGYWRCAWHKCSNGNFANSLFLAVDMYIRTWLFPIQKYVDKFVCVSDFEKGIYLKFRPDWEPKLVRVYNPIKQLEPAMSQKGGYLLYLGRLSREKGIGTLIRAMKKHPQYRLKIVGTGNCEDMDNPPANVTFCGYKEGSELAGLVAGAMYTVIPSEWYETFGLTVVESFTLGTPVIAANIGGLSELVDDRKTGFLFEPGNVSDLTAVIGQALSIDKNTYAGMADNARKKASDFEENIYYTQLMSLYESLMK